MQPNLFINHVADLKKLLAFLTAGTSATFHVKDDLRDLVIQLLKDFSRSHSIAVHEVTPSREKSIVCYVGGLMAGAGAGAKFAGLPGAIVGASVGLMFGYACAPLRVRIHPRAEGQPGFTVKVA